MGLSRGLNEASCCHSQTSLFLSFPEALLHLPLGFQDLLVDPLSFFLALDLLVLELFEPDLTRINLLIRCLLHEAGDALVAELVVLVELDGFVEFLILLLRPLKVPLHIGPTLLINHSGVWLLVIDALATQLSFRALVRILLGCWVAKTLSLVDVERQRWADTLLIHIGFRSILPVRQVIVRRLCINKRIDWVVIFLVARFNGWWVLLRRWNINQLPHLILLMFILLSHLQDPRLKSLVALLLWFWALGFRLCGGLPWAAQEGSAEECVVLAEVLLTLTTCKDTFPVLLSLIINSQ